MTAAIFIHQETRRMALVMFYIVEDICFFKTECAFFYQTPPSAWDFFAVV